jgi:hypothetical protein
MARTLKAFRIAMLAAAGALLPQAGFSAELANDSLRLVDLTAQFDKVALETAGMDDKSKVAAFEKAMTPLAEGFYARSRKPDRYDTRVLKTLAAYPEKRDKILAVSKQFSALLAPARASFEKQFGPVHSEQPVYLLHSLGEMDGGTRDLDGKATLIFGADGIVNYHDGQDLTPFFHHELFHLSHEKPFGECKPVWCSLWEEGLATYVGASLNPGAGDAALMLDLPKPIRPAVDANRKGAVCAVRAILNSTDEKDYASLFYGNASIPGWPSRMGYYVGYLAMVDLGKTHSLKQLADMPQAEAKAALEGALDRMASCA